MLIAVRAVTIMSTDMDEQTEDVNMNDSVNEAISGSIDVASKAYNDVMEPSPTAPTNIELEENNGTNAEDDYATKLAKDEQSNVTSNHTNPVTEVEDTLIDIWGGTFGKDSEKPSPDVLIARLQDENLALEDKIAVLENEIKGITGSGSNLALKNKVAVLENKVAILKGEKAKLLNTSDAKIAELKAFITTQRGALSNTNNTINNANKTIAGKQKQLDSVYAALLRQENQIIGQQHHIINQQNQLTAQAAQISRQSAQINTHAAQLTALRRVQGDKLARVRKCIDKLVRSAVLKFEANTSATRRFASELHLLLNNRVEDPEETESEEEGEGEGVVDEEDDGEEKEIEVIDLLDDDDGGEVAAVEELGHVQQSAVIEQPETVQQPLIVEQDVEAVQAVTSEESPSKRVKLTEEA
jgi:uncharacterized coiled-coil protein SlyX